MKSTDVIISGGGIPGLTLGILLVQAGLEVTICDPSPLLPPDEITPSGRTSALMEGSLSVLNRAGLLEKVEAVSQDLKTLSIVDREFRAEFASHEIGLPRFGQNIQNTLLQAHAAQQFRSFQNARLIQDKISDFDITPQKVIAEFANGEMIVAKLLIGADGRNSPVRTKSGIEIRERDYDQVALTGIISHSEPHHSASTEFHFSGGPFTIVPMQDNRCSYVWMEKTQDAKQMLLQPKHELESIMQMRSQGLVGKISLTGGIESYPIKIQRAATLIAGRVALIAEAAHVLSPIGAQGMNLSLRDVAALSEIILNAARCGLDIGSKPVLQKYDNERYLDIGLRIAGTDALNRSVATENNFIRNLKKFGLQTAKIIQPLRSVLVHEALAPRVSFAQEILSGLDTRATVSTSTRAAPAA